MKSIVKCIADNEKSLSDFEKTLKNTSDKSNKYLLEYPTVYIHNWPYSDKYEVYVGEANDFFKRTREHYRESKKTGTWQKKCKHNKESKVYVIGNEHFNKSLTLDVENRLMHYLTSVENVKRVHNGRGNPQKKYYTDNEFETIFHDIWTQLNATNKVLFPDENKIKDSALYKASPFHKLTEKQEEARDTILNLIEQALDENSKDKETKIIFIDGEAGTGKTVLNTSTFYKLFCKKNEEGNDKFRFSVVINHTEQVKVYKDIVKKLGIYDQYGETVTKASRFLNLHPKNKSVDVVFIDEAHLLFTEGNQGYSGKNQLDDIVKKAKVVVIVFDENQILRMDQYWESQMIKKYKDLAEENGSHVTLTEQLRIVADDDTIKWIDSFTKDNIVKAIPNNDSHNYDIKIFDSPLDLEIEINKKAKSPDTKLSRIIANYDWPYKEGKRPKESDRIPALMRYLEYFRPDVKDTWGVFIEKANWYKPWNYETQNKISIKDKRIIKEQSWAEQAHTINEVGSTFTIQGFDLNYAGVIIGESVKYRNGKIVFDPSKTSNGKVNRNRTMLDGSKQSFAKDLLKHEIRVLMTRGVNGLYIYACDDELRAALKAAAK